MTRRDSDAPAPSTTHPESVDSYFSDKAVTYHEDSSRGLWRWYRSMETRAVMGVTDPRPGEAILDAGCGAGHYSEALLRAGAEVTSLDGSSAMLASVQSRLRVETIEADLVTARLEARFDKIACLGVLEFVADAEQVLRNLVAGLRPGGPKKIVLLVPARSWRGRLYRSFHRSHGVSVRLFSRTDLDALADAAGMKVEETVGVTHNLVARLGRA